MTMGTPPALILDAALKRRITVVTTKTQLAEIGRILHKPSVNKRLKYTDKRISDFIRFLTIKAKVVAEVSYPNMSPDMADNAILACAIDGKADVIVTGDKKHLLSLDEFQGIPIITPRQFVDEYL